IILQRFRDGDGPYFIDYGELGIKPVMGSITSDVPAGPGVQNNGLADLDPGDPGTGINHDPQGITSGDMDGSRIPSAEYRARKPQSGKMCVIIGSRGQNRYQNPD